MTKIFAVKDKDDIWNLPEIDGFLSEFPTSKNIDVETLKWLLSGKAIVDLSDGEYIHWLQLSDESKKFVQQMMK